MRSTTELPPSRTLRGPLGWLNEQSLRGMARREAMLGYLFLLPTLLGLLIFTAGPVVASLGLSLYEWNVIDPPTFIGLGNYRYFLRDRQAMQSIQNTLVFVVFAVSLQIIVALLLALMVEQKMATWLRNGFRVAFFMPILTSSASIALVLGYMFNREFGVVNYYLSFLGIQAIPWLSSSRWVMTTIVLTAVWQSFGFTFILFVGGLRNIPRDLLDAADVDGATGLRRLWMITIPLLSPTILFALVTSVIGALQLFDLPTIMTSGGPGDASRTVVMLIYESAFRNLELGYASTLAMILLTLILVVTAVQFWLSNRWVFYQ
jgi:multiple sugar transport system permease protein